MSDYASPLTDDAIAIVLAASHLGLARGAAATPLGAVGWNDVASGLHAAGLRPSWLLGRSAEELQTSLDCTGSTIENLALLMQRAGSIAFDLERLAQRGVWTLTRADEEYPARLTSRLGARRPPVLFGAGPRSLLDARSVAVVGSRDVDDDGGVFAERVGACAARSGLGVVSGGARGVDRKAMSAALEAGGNAVGVLVDNLERWLRDPELRQAISEDRLVLLTPYKPDAGFTAANAMARNKLIYCLADYALVIASDKGKGGTWSGASENMKHDWVPLFVRDAPDAPAGNHALIGRGAIPLTERDLDSREPLDEILDAKVADGEHFVNPPGDSPDADPKQLGLLIGAESVEKPRKKRPAAD